MFLLVDNRQKPPKNALPKAAKRGKLVQRSAFGRIAWITWFLLQSVLTATYYYYKIRLPLGELYILVWRGYASLHILKKSRMLKKILCRGQHSVELHESLHSFTRVFLRSPTITIKYVSEGLSNRSTAFRDLLRSVLLFCCAAAPKAEAAYSTNHEKRCWGYSDLPKRIL